MCLTLVKKQFDPPDPTVREGWKWFVIDEDRLLAPFQENVEFPIGEWKHDPNPENIKYSGDYSYDLYCGRYVDTRRYYAGGYHLFETRQDARDYGCSKDGGVLLKVKYKNVTTTGEDHGQNRAVVAQSIMVLPGQLKKKKIVSYILVKK